MRVEGLASGRHRAGHREARHRAGGGTAGLLPPRGEHPGNLDHVAQAALYGSLAGNTGTVNLWQKNRAGREGFRFRVRRGVDRQPDPRERHAPQPALRLRTLEVNPGNYLVYRFDKRLEADLDLTHGTRRFALRASPPPARPTASGSTSPD